MKTSVEWLKEYSDIDVNSKELGDILTMTGSKVETIEHVLSDGTIELIKVNPKNTSKIGKEKYSARMKLSVHQAASYVIARRGQGYQDKLVS